MARFTILVPLSIVVGAVIGAANNMFEWTEDQQVVLLASVSFLLLYITRNIE
jgi:hypothetical protein